MNAPREHLIDWLRDAHAMEKAAIQILQRQDERLENYPEMHRKVREHLEVSRRQADQVADCIERLDGDSSTLKDLTGSFAANMNAMMNAMSSDEVVKDGIADYAFEHFEIASYRSLIAAAEAANEPEIAQICQDILQEEEAMADWLAEHLPTTTQTFLQRERADVEAKR